MGEEGIEYSTEPGSQGMPVEWTDFYHDGNRWRRYDETSSKDQ
jgi:hypothetical protein